MAVAKPKPSSLAKKPLEKTFSLDVRHEPFKKVLFCNKFLIERLKSHWLFAFGLQSQSGEPLDSYCVVVTNQDMENIRRNWLDYLGKIGLPQNNIREFTGWRPPFSREQSVETSNLIRLGRIGEIAEFRFFNFPFSRMLDPEDGRTAPHGVETSPLALIRCDLDLQIHFLMTIFADELESQ